MPCQTAIANDFDIGALGCLSGKWACVDTRGPGCCGMLPVDAYTLTGTRPTEADIPTIRAILAERDIRALSVPISPQDGGAHLDCLARRIVAHWSAHGFGVSLWLNNGHPVALAGLAFCVTQGEAAIELCFAVTAPARNKGIATRAVDQILQEAPAITETITATVRRGNAPAYRILGSAGFRATGEFLDGAETLLGYRWMSI